MNAFSFERSQYFSKSVDETFQFFAEPYNLEKITPEFLKFRIITPQPISMGEGTCISYSLKLRGLPIKWTSLISEWNPPFGFVDQQIRGPYKYWRHEHVFEQSASGTKVIDKVFYKLPGLFLAPVIDKYYVARDLQKIFDFRAEIMEYIFRE